MGQQIIKQPDGQFAIFSSESDTIIMWDASGPEIIDWFVEQAAEQARRSAERLLGHVASEHPRKAYYQFTVTWEEALSADQEHGGEAWRQWRTPRP
jgi:hypothetical protein